MDSGRPPGRAGDLASPVKAQPLSEEPPRRNQRTPGRFFSTVQNYCFFFVFITRIVIDVPFWLTTRIPTPTAGNFTPAVGWTGE